MKYQPTFILVFIISFWAVQSQAQYKFTVDKRIEATSVKNQQNTGTCWSFSTASFIESELIRLGKGKHDLSEMFVVRKIYWSQLWVKTLHFQCNTLVMRKNRVSSANLSNLPALRHGLAKEDFQSERKTPVLSVQGGLVRKSIELRPTSRKSPV